MFWLICALLTLVVAAAIAAPLWRSRAKPVSASYDLQVYRDQLREVDRDQERGIIGVDEAAQLRTEIGRKILDADRRITASKPLVRQSNHLSALVVLAVIMAGAVGLYFLQGAPGLPDLPLAKRISLANQTYQSRPSQAEAEAAAPARQPAEADPEYIKLVETLRETVAKKPDDLEGLTLLATHESRLGNMKAAKDAQQKLVDLLGKEVDADQLMRLSALMIETAGGIITPEADKLLEQALKKNPDLPQGRYLMGMLQLQNGRPDRAFPIWRGLLEAGPPDAPWIAPIRQNIQDLAWIAGYPDYVPPDEVNLSGPTTEDMAAAADMTPEDREKFIESMVAQLETRLANEGGSADEWARLIGSLGVLGQTEKAQIIYNEASQRFGDQPKAMELIQAAAQRAGLSE